ncbi:MAG: type II toxin-antitoxin system VapC family toxin [Bacillota bacterium]
MSNYVCLDTSVIIKILLPEDDSDKATALINSVIQSRQVIVLPVFAWAEVGTVLLQRHRRGMLTAQEIDDLWSEFKQFPGIEYLGDEMIMDLTWKISQSFSMMTTLYDASFLAVAEVVAERTGETCEFWTADEKLVNALNGRKGYVKLLKDFGPR